VTHIELDLSRHCIATEVKRLYNRRLSDFFKGRGDQAAVEADIALLARALDELDLPALRGRHRLLAGGEPVAVILSGSEDTPLCLTLAGDTLDLDRYGKG
jgi:hypothetical protein